MNFCLQPQLTLILPATAKNRLLSLSRPYCGTRGGGIVGVLVQLLSTQWILHRQVIYAWTFVIDSKVISFFVFTVFIKFDCPDVLLASLLSGIGYPFLPAMLLHIALHITHPVVYGTCAETRTLPRHEEIYSLVHSIPFHRIKTPLPAIAS